MYGYDPYAPSNSEYIIKDINEVLEMKFDGIFSHDLLEHLKKPIDEFQIFSQILTDDGSMAHSTGCYKYVYEYDRFHLVFYTGNSVNVLCNKTGFKVVDKQENDNTLTYNYIYKKRNG